MRRATGSEQRWSPRCWVGGRCQGARFDSVWSRRTGQDITVSDIAAAAFVTVRAVQLPPARPRHLSGGRGGSERTVLIYGSEDRGYGAGQMPRRGLRPVQRQPGAHAVPAATPPARRRRLPRRGRGGGHGKRGG